MRRVQFDRFGGPEVLHLGSVPEPHARPNQLRIRVQFAGLNPVDAKVFMNAPTARPYAIEFPSGNGIDFAGYVDEVGADVEEFSVGEVVFGARQFAAQADEILVEPGDIVRCPADLDVRVAGSLSIAGRTAWASVHRVRPTPADTVLVSAAAGGVGVLAAQLARRTGARVIGTASRANHAFLRSLDIEPVDYHGDLVARVRDLAPQGITAALDNSGRATVDAALALGAPPSRINSIADYAAASDYGTSRAGGADAPAHALAEVADLLASGRVVLPVDSVLPLERVREAYDHLLKGHVRGKVVLDLR